MRDEGKNSVQRVRMEALRMEKRVRKKKKEPEMMERAVRMERESSEKVTKT